MFMSKSNLYLKKFSLKKKNFDGKFPLLSSRPMGPCIEKILQDSLGAAGPRQVPGGVGMKFWWSQLVLGFQ